MESVLGTYKILRRRSVYDALHSVNSFASLTFLGTKPDPQAIVTSAFLNLNDALSQHRPDSHVRIASQSELALAPKQEVTFSSPAWALVTALAFL